MIDAVAASVEWFTLSENGDILAPMALVHLRKTIPQTLVRWLPLLLVFVTIAGIALLLGRSAGSVGASGGAIAIDGGHDHTCAVLEDGGVQCWGQNTSGQLGDGTLEASTTPVDVCAAGSGPACVGGSRLEGIVDVAAGFSHTCVLTEDGGVLCWGNGEAGQLGDGTTNNHSNPAAVCESGSGVGCSGGSALTGAEAIAAGSEFSCALMSDTGIKCWGSDAVGQLGIGTLPPMAGQGLAGFGLFETLPQDVCGFTIFLLSLSQPAGVLPCLPLTGFAGVAAGGEHACGLLASGGIKCWGSGPLGDGTTNTTGLPVDVCSQQFAGEEAGILCAPLGGFTNVQAGFQHTCALTEAGGVMCWGRNDHGEIGDGTLNDRTTPVDVCASGSGGGCGGGAMLAGITAVTAGSEYTCAIAAAGDARCWGSNFAGQLGDGTTSDRQNPVGVSGLPSGVTTIAGGSRSDHACAARADGSLSCWGRNNNGQLGIGSSDVDDHTAPEEVVGFAPKITPTPTASDTPTSTPTVPTNTPAPGETPEPTATPGANGLIGDVDCNGEINAIDAAFILQFVAGLIDELPCPENADVNEDGSTDTIDAALILQFSAGLLNMLPP